MVETDNKYVLAIDTSNECIAAAVGVLNVEEKRVDVCKQIQQEAHRASNQHLLECVQQLMDSAGMSANQLACVVCGKGPGSFTGVRIALATAKGISTSLGIPLISVSTLDAVAWSTWNFGIRGRILVVADAMRKEIYPVYYVLDDAGAERQGHDCVLRADVLEKKLSLAADNCTNSCSARPDAGPANLGPECSKLTNSRFANSVSAHSEPEYSEFDHSKLAPSEPANSGPAQSGLAHSEPEYSEFDHSKLAPSESANLDLARSNSSASGKKLIITGDALLKYSDTLQKHATCAPKECWFATGAGLLAAFQLQWQKGMCDPFDVDRHNPAFALPVYTRLSDAEEQERVRLAHGLLSARGTHGSTHVTLNDTAINNLRGQDSCCAFKPLDALHIKQISHLEKELMGSDAWSENLFLDELKQNNRVWWMCLAAQADLPVESDAPVLAYAGVLVNNGVAEILKIATCASEQRKGIARALLEHVSDDARNLGANKLSLEVRKSNKSAQAFYDACGFEKVGMRAHYYSDGEDACLMQADIATVLQPSHTTVGGMHMQRIDYEASNTAYRKDASSGASPYAKKNSSSLFTQPLILAVETSCDETAVALVDGTGNILANVLASQVDFHARFGGVVPEIASRKHIEVICSVCSTCFSMAQEKLSCSPEELGWNQVCAVAATYSPGLVGALVVGVAFAKGAAWAKKIPYIGVNHLEGHLYANKIDNPNFAPPAVVSLLSGGNTLLVYMKDWGTYETLGYTIDDAVGEAFDKVAKALGLGYPGGPIMSTLAAKGNSSAISFPRALLHSGDYRFSLSGLKTAVCNYINQERELGHTLNKEDICASFTAAVVDVQVAKARTALQQTGAPCLCVGGGVAANPTLRDAYKNMCREMKVELLMPPLSACTDNAAMIGLVALDRYKQKKFFPLNADAQAHSCLDEAY